MNKTRLARRVAVLCRYALCSYPSVYIMRSRTAAWYKLCFTVWRACSRNNPHTDRARTINTGGGVCETAYLVNRLGVYVQTIILYSFCRVNYQPWWFFSFTAPARREVTHFQQIIPSKSHLLLVFVNVIMFKIIIKRSIFTAKVYNKLSDWLLFSVATLVSYRMLKITNIYGY